LSNYESLLNLAVAKKYITESEQEILKEWNTAPESWGIEV
jgi:orotate phosphoribosyltransferase